MTHVTYKRVHRSATFPDGILYWDAEVKVVQYPIEQPVAEALLAARWVPQWRIDETWKIAQRPFGQHHNL